MAKVSRSLHAQWVTGLLCSVSVVVAFGCGTDFDSPDKVETLRVFGIQKDHPYAAPTVDPSSPSEVQLSMLSHDGSPAPGEALRTVQRLWFSGCDDLPGDEYFSCLLRIHYMWRAWETWSGDNPNFQLTEGTSWSLLNSLPPTDDPLRTTVIEGLLELLNPTLPLELAEAYFDTYRIGAGERFTYTIPPGIIENHRSTTDPKVPPYGLAFIFFTACAGDTPNLSEAPEWKDVDPTNPGGTLTNATLGFPLICKDKEGITLDSDNFIAGYTQQYVYGDGSANLNPVIESVTFNNIKYDFDRVAPGMPCLDDDCVQDAGPSPDACQVPVDDNQKNATPPHVKACRDHCPSYEFKPGMDSAKNNDVDTFTSAGGSPVSEQMWIDYYAERGELKGSARSLRDTTLGWFDDYGQKWKPPALADAGPALLWAVVHDNRGGVAWLRVQVCIDDP